MNLFRLCFFMIFFNLLPKCFCDDLIELNKPKILSTTQMLLGKPFKMICKTRISARTSFRFGWQHNNDPENITLYQSASRRDENVGLNKETLIESTLTFFPVKKSHEGEYNCTLSFNGKNKKEPVVENKFFSVIEEFHVPTFHPESIWYVLDKNEKLPLSCSGMAEVEWMKMGMPPVDPYSKQKLEFIVGTKKYYNNSDPSKNIYPFTVEATIENVQAQDTGNYTCIYKAHNFIDIDVWEMEKYNLFRNVYVFVRDTYDLYVKTPTRIMGTQGLPLTVPCRPTFPEVKVALFKLDDDTILYPRPYDTSVKFSNTDGFTVPMTKPFKAVSGYACVFQSDFEKYEVIFEFLSEPLNETLVKPALLNFNPSPEKFRSVTLICHMPFLKIRPRELEWKIYSDIKTDNMELFPTTIIKGEHYSIAEKKLRIKRVTEDTRGTYLCAVYGDLGNYAESQMYMDISYPRLQKPLLTAENYDYLTSNKNIVVKNGASVILICKSNSPIMWKRSFLDIPPSDVTAKIINFNRKVENKPPLPMPKSGQVGIPIKKYRMSFEFNENQKYSFLSKLILTNLTRKDVGLYSCIYSEKSREVEDFDIYELSRINMATSIFIFVNGSNKLFTPSVRKMTGIQNEPIIIPCQPTEPSVTVNLYRNGLKALRHAYTFRPSSGITLKYTEFMGMKEKFTCEYRSGDKIQQASYLVDVIPSPDSVEDPVLITPTNRPVIGSKIVIRCSVKTLQHVPFSFKIFHQKKDLNNDERIKMETKTTHVGNMTISNIRLRIKNLNPEDEGNYECNVHDFFHNIKSTFFYLNVFETMKEPPLIMPNEKSIQLMPNEGSIQLNSGEDFHVKCNATSESSWYKFGKNERPKGDFTPEIESFENKTGLQPWTLDDIDDKRSIQHRSIIEGYFPFVNYLVLKSVTYEDIGYYYCVANEDAKSDTNIETLLKQKKANRMYLFVKNENKLHATSNYPRQKYKKYTPIVIPCRPSSNEVETTLFKDDITNMITKAKYPNDVSFDSREGFSLRPSLLSTSRNEILFGCIYKIQNSSGVEMNLVDFVTVDIIPEDIDKPKINFNHMALDKPFEINCSLNTSKDAVLRIDWFEYPTKSNLIDSNIVIKTEVTVFPKTNVKKVSNSLKILKVNANHQGLFKCKVEDVYGNIRHAIQDIKILNYVTYTRGHLPPYIKQIDQNYKDFERKEFHVTDITVTSKSFKLRCSCTDNIMWRFHSKLDRPYGDVTKKMEALIKYDEVLKTDNNGLSTLFLAGKTNMETEKFAVFDDINIVANRLTVNDVNVDDMGFYTCVNEKEYLKNYDVNELELTGRAKRLYVFVNNSDQLFKPTSNEVITYIENTVFVIPCLPTSRDVVVKLYSNFEEVPPKVLNSHTSFDPTIGFTIYNDSFLNYDEPIKCGFGSSKFSHMQFQFFFLEKILRKYDANQDITISNFGQNVAVCKTKLDKKIPYAITWTFPNQDVERRATIKKKCKNTEFFKMCQSTMTIKDFSYRDTGVYYCNRIDIFSYTETASTILMESSDREAWKILHQVPGLLLCGKSFAKQVIGSDAAEIEEYPWLVRVGQRICPLCTQIEYFCAGSLVSDRFVITAGFCLKDIYESKNELKLLPIVRLGDHRLKYQSLDDPDRYQIINGIDFQVPPYYAGETKVYNDIGILMLEHPAKLNRWVFPICLPRQTLDIRIDNKDKGFYSLAGWGMLPKNITNPAPDILIAGEIKFVSGEECGVFGPVSFCIKGDVSPCQGDVGSPIMWNDKEGNHVLIGLVSKIANDECSEYAPATHFTYFSTHMGFLLKAVETMYMKHVEGKN